MSALYLVLRASQIGTTYRISPKPQNRKINIEVIKLIGVMASTTISVSREFHEWLKSKGKKGENYEGVIKRLLKPNLIQELERFGIPSHKLEEDIKQKTTLKSIKYGLENISPDSKTKPKKEKVIKSQKIKIPNIGKNKQVLKPKTVKKRLQKPKFPETKITKKPNIWKKLSTTADVVDEEESNRWETEKNLELQRLQTELELAKLSNDTAKMGELAASISKLKEELNQK